MAEYVDREKLLERMKYYFEHTGGDAHYTYGVAMREIENAPAEEVLPVVHGEWKVTVLEDHYGVVRTGSPHCSVCGKTSPCRTAFCPNCFAKMDGGIIKPMKRAGDSAKKAAESLIDVIDAFENAVQCVRCREIVPEGRQVCPGCETGGNFDG